MALRKILPASGLQRHGLTLRIIAAVIDHHAAIALLDGNGEGHLRGRDHVAAADFIARKTQLQSHAVQQALHHEGALRTARAARGGGGRLVGQAEINEHAIGGQDIGPDEIGRGVEGQRNAIGRGGAVIINQRATNAAQAAIRFEGGFDCPDLLALANAGGEAFEAILHPFDRALEQQRRSGHGELFGMEHGLCAKAPAHLRRHHAQLMFGKAERRHQHGLGAVRHLGGVPDRELIRDLVMARHDAAQLHGMAAALVEAKLLAHHMDSALENAVHIAVIDLGARHEIVGTREPRLRGAGLQTLHRINNDRQRFNIKLHQRRRILGDATRGRDDHGDGLAHIADLGDGEAGWVDIETQAACG